MSSNVHVSTLQADNNDKMVQRQPCVSHLDDLSSEPHSLVSASCRVAAQTSNGTDQQGLDTIPIAAL